MPFSLRKGALALVIAPATLMLAMSQSVARDGIADLIADAGEQIEKSTGDPAIADPRSGDPSHEQARALMKAIEDVLSNTADQRSTLKRLPGKDEFLIPPIWTETREDREVHIKRLLDSALGIVTDVPVVEVQKRIEAHRKFISGLEEKIARLREKQLTAPQEATLPGVLTDTVDSLDREIKDLTARIEINRQEIADAKSEIAVALTKSGVTLEPDQLDLLLDGVLSGDLVRLVATFKAAKLIDGQLAKLVSAAGDNTAAARRYFAMHAALFAMLVHAQDMAISKIDTQYMPRLDAILKDLQSAKSKTAELLKANNRPDQKRALEANRESQKIAEEAAKAYRRYLQQQREQIAEARKRATHDLRIADNTFETVEASFQLENLMRDGSASFEALGKLEAPTFEQIFKNEELRREFEALTRKLDQPTS